MCQTLAFIEDFPELPLQVLGQCLAQAQKQGLRANFFVFRTPFLEHHVVLIGPIGTGYHVTKLVELLLQRVDTLGCAALISIVCLAQEGHRVFSQNFI